VLIAAAVAVAIVVGAAVLVVALGGGSPRSDVTARRSLTKALPGAAAARALLVGVRQRGNVLGAAAAPVTVVEYVDLQCPYCQQFETQVQPMLIRRYVRTGKVKIELRPLAFIGPDSVRGRAAVLAAGEQNRMFDVVQLLYLNQGPENSGWLDDAMVKHAAASVPGLDVRRLLVLRGFDEVSRMAAGFDADATRDDVRSTPTVLVGPTGGVLHEVGLRSPTDLEKVEEAIAAAID
jgi:protein-disulfide isomerase